MSKTRDEFDAIFERAFGEWAFGQGTLDQWRAGEIDGIGLMEAWNDRHGESLVLCGHGIIKEDSVAMRNLYIAHLDEESTAMRKLHEGNVTKEDAPNE